MQTALARRGKSAVWFWASMIRDCLCPGSVGTGFDSEQATALKAKLAKLEQKEYPFAEGPPKPGRWSKRERGSERWVKPILVAEVEFAEWTPDGHVRHASFLSLRTDKDPKTISREMPNQTSD